MRFMFRLGGGSFGTVLATTFERDKFSRSPPSVVDTAQTYAVKLLEADRANDFPNLFLRNALRELCACPDSRDDQEAFFSKTPHVTDVWFYPSSSPHDGSPLTDSIAIVLKKYTCDCATWFKTGTLSNSDITHVMLQLLQAVDTLHAAGMAHRDIKPGNMLVDLSSGDIVLSDFGFVSLLEGAMMRKASQDLCTIDTRAPELCLDAEADGTLPVCVGTKADMWSVGISLLCALLSRDSQPLGNVVYMEGNKKEQRTFLRQRFAGEFAPLGPDPGPHPTSVREWLARVLGATSDLADAATRLPFKMSLGQALVLTQCLRLDPAERVTARELLGALCINSPRRRDPDRMSALLPFFAKRQHTLRAKAQAEQSAGTLPSSRPFRAQYLLDGKSFLVGQPAPAFVSKPFRGVDDRGAILDEGRKERVRTLNNMTIMLRCAVSSSPSSASASSSKPARRVRMADTLLLAVELFDRLISPTVIARMKAMTVLRLSSSDMIVGGKAVTAFFTDKVSDPRYERRDLQVVCLYMADLVLHFDGQSLRRLIFTAYPRSCGIFGADCTEVVYEMVWAAKSELVLQWVLEAARSLQFDFLRGSLLRSLEQRGGLHRHRETVLGVFKALEVMPAQEVDVARVAPHAKALQWGFAAVSEDGTRALFDVDF